MYTYITDCFQRLFLLCMRYVIDVRVNHLNRKYYTL